MSRRHPIAMMNAETIFITAHENGFSITPGGLPHPGAESDLRVISTTFELVEAMIEWAYHHIPDFPAFDPRSPYGKPVTEAAIEVLRRQQRGPLRAGAMAPGFTAPPLGMPPGNLSGVAHPHKPAAPAPEAGGLPPSTQDA